MRVEVVVGDRGIVCQHQPIITHHGGMVRGWRSGLEIIREIGGAQSRMDVPLNAPSDDTRLRTSSIELIEGVPP